MAIATKVNIATITGKDADDIDDLWVTLADNWVKTLLNQSFDATAQDTQYIEIARLNDFNVDYDGVRKFALDKIPVSSVDSVTYKPDDTSPVTWVENTDYYVDLEEGTIKIDDDETVNIGERMLKVIYTYGYSAAPQAVKDYADYWASFMLESVVAKNADGVALKEIEIGRYREAYANSSAALQAKYAILGQLESIILERYKNWEP